MTQPRVTVLMAVCNGAAYLPEALESLEVQTLADFELLVVEDGSTDATPDILRRQAQRDPRLRILTNPGNLGLTRSLNLGLEQARGEFVARQDADDRSRPDRLARQCAFLERHPEVGLVGGECAYLDPAGRPRPKHDPAPATEDLTIRWLALFDNPFYHSTMMFRRSLVTGQGLRYNPELFCAQDFDLWSRMLDCTQGANLDPAQPLVDYRIHPQSVTARHREAQRAIALAVSRTRLTALWPENLWSREEILALRRLVSFGCTAFGPPEQARGRILLELLERLLAAHPDAAPAQRRSLRRRVLGQLLGLVPAAAWARPGAGSSLVAAVARRDPVTTLIHLGERLRHRLRP
ncbi:MAG: glycosyltransferase [Magnetococcales bacterium]|nr:glycosyltransferase [Magnetococcales bacterium]